MSLARPESSLRSRRQPLQLWHLEGNRSFGDRGGTYLQIRRVLLDPLSCDARALVGPRLVTTDRDGLSAISVSYQRVAHETRDLAEEFFDVRIPQFDQVEQLVGSGTGIAPDDCMHCPALPGRNS